MNSFKWFCVRFEETPEGLDIEIATADKEEIAHKFSTGDSVEVIEGELQNLQVYLFLDRELRVVRM